MAPTGILHELNINYTDIPSRDDVARELPPQHRLARVFVREHDRLLAERATQTEVADLHAAVRVHEAVRRLQVPVVHAGGVQQPIIMISVRRHSQRSTIVATADSQR